MKKAFSMIELIFSIVIIGILASFALPKLMVTKNDAVSVVIKKEVSATLELIQAFYYANSNLKGNNATSTLQNAIKLDTKWNLFKNSTGSENLVYSYNVGDDLNNNKIKDKSCIVIEFDNNSNLNLYIADKSSLDDTTCASIRKLYQIDDTQIGTYEYDFELNSANGVNKVNFIKYLSQNLNPDSINW